MLKRNRIFLRTLPIYTQLHQHSKKSDEPIEEQLLQNHQSTYQPKYQYNYKYQASLTKQTRNKAYSFESFMIAFYIICTSILFFSKRQQQLQHDSQANFAKRMFDVISRPDKSISAEEKDEIKEYFYKLSTDDKYNHLNNAYSHCLDTNSTATKEYIRNHKSSLVSIKLGEETSLLTYATYTHNYQAAMFLIELGADIARIDPYRNNTLLHFLCNNRDTTAEHNQLITAIISKLDKKEKAPFLYFQDSEGKTALDIAKYNKNQDIIAILQNTQVSKPYFVNMVANSVYQACRGFESFKR